MLHGNSGHERIAEFGETILFYVPKKRRRKLEPKYRFGVFLSRSWMSDQNYIGLMDGSITTARAMVRVVETSRWDQRRLRRVSGTPIDLHATHAADDAVESGDAPPQRT